MNELLKNALPVGIIVSVPALMALLGILFNRQDYARMEARMETRFSALERRVDGLGEKVDRLRETLHSDVQQLLRLDADKDVRIAKLEPRS